MKRLVLLLFVVACGGEAGKDAHAPEAPAQKAGAAPPGHAQPGYPAPSPAPPPLPWRFEDRERDITSIEDGEQALGEDEQALAQALESGELSTLCHQVCSAIRSMRRSVGALCELAGDGDERCRRARERLEAGERRVESSGCRC
jgi:hypothetical protein